MRKELFNNNHSSTAFVLLDSKLCQACWNCLDVCFNDVIGRINLPWHKHIKFIKASACKGCMKCVKSCKTGAISKIFKENGGYYDKKY
ncbi:MAG: 4Fe-4S dicluster domain-containing protein [Candidatus Kapabacteria bacterium]|nr:4Fe-4S dicluster domain-containing protein [Candidatus Kapabacteria bacterium]